MSGARFQRRLFGATPATKAPSSVLPGGGKGWGKEHLIQAATKEFLEFALDGIAYWKGIDAANKDAKERVMRAARGCRAGVPDFEVAWKRPDGTTLLIGIEMKSRDGSMSSDQRAIRAEITDLAGGFYHVCRNTFEVEAVLREHGLPIKARHLAFGLLKEPATASAAAKVRAKPAAKAAPRAKGNGR